MQKASGENSATVLLSYSLAPGRQYPEQLKQAISLLRYLVDAGKKLEDVSHSLPRSNEETHEIQIVMAGDSAGANLALGALSHLLYAHPAIDPMQISSPLRGVLLISPWVCFATSSPSYSQNSNKDVINATILEKWSAYYLGQAKPDHYNQPLSAPATWWEEVNDKVREMVILAGTDETPFSDTKKFAEVLKTMMSNLKVLFAAGETHDQPFMEPLTGEKTPSETTQFAQSWLISNL